MVPCVQRQKQSEHPRWECKECDPRSTAASRHLLRVVAGAPRTAPGAAALTQGGLISISGGVPSLFFSPSQIMVSSIRCGEPLDLRNVAALGITLGYFQRHPFPWILGPQPEGHVDSSFPGKCGHSCRLPRPLACSPMSGSPFWGSVCPSASCPHVEPPNPHFLFSAPLLCRVTSDTPCLSAPSPPSPRCLSSVPL